jgi:hypothetical protein
MYLSKSMDSRLRGNDNLLIDASALCRRSRSLPIGANKCGCAIGTGQCNGFAVCAFAPPLPSLPGGAAEPGIHTAPAGVAEHQSRWIPAFANDEHHRSIHGASAAFPRQKFSRDVESHHRQNATASTTITSMIV